MDPTQGVVILVGGIAAALRKAADAAEDQRTRHIDVRKDGGRRSDSEIGRACRVAFDEVDADAVHTGAQFVGQRGRENVSVAQGEERALGRAVVAESGQVVALERRFGAAVAVDDEAAEQQILRRDVVVDAAGVLIEVPVARRRPHEESASRVVGTGH